MVKAFVSNSYKMNKSDPALRIGGYCSFLTNAILIFWTIESCTLPVGNTASIVADVNDSPTAAHFRHRQLADPQGLLNSPLQAVCSFCRLGENGKLCSGSMQGECDCSSDGNAICRCKADWLGDACQYQIAKISCEKMRDCILCLVYGSGPFNEGTDCQSFCDGYYPTPLIVKTLDFKDDEHLCSFIHLTDESVECRYFFKYGVRSSGEDKTTQAGSLYIIAQQEMDCGNPVKFPQLRRNKLNENNSFSALAKNYNEAVKSSDEHYPTGEAAHRNNFVAVVIVFVFVALPFVACVFSMIYNFSNLPCGLCNVFRQSSSKYLRNVRPFPGFAVNNSTEL